MDAAWSGASSAGMQVSARTAHIAHARFAMRHTPALSENGPADPPRRALAAAFKRQGSILIAQPCKSHQRIERRKPHSVKAVQDEITDI